MLRRHRDSLAAEEMSGEIVTVHQLEYFAINVDINSHVQIPHRYEFTFEDPRTWLYVLESVTLSYSQVITCVRINLLEGDLMSPHNPPLGHTGVLLGQLHHCQGVILQVEINL